MSYKVKLIRHYIPDKVLIADLRKAAKRLKKPGRQKYISYTEYKKEGEFNPATLVVRFDSWNAALLKAGLNIKYKPPASDEVLLLNIKEIWDALGRQPLCDEMRCTLSKYSPTAYIRRFGSWNSALLAFEKAVKKGKFKASKSEAGKKQIRIKFGNLKRNKRKLKKFVKNLHISKSLRYDVFNRDRFRCRACGASPANDLKVTLHCDHIIPVSRGGKTILSNLQTLCKDCNSGKGTKSISPHV